MTEALEVLGITYNRVGDLRRTLKALLDSPFARCGVTVLDDRSTDATRRSAAGLGPRARRGRSPPAFVRHPIRRNGRLLEVPQRGCWCNRDGPRPSGRGRAGAIRGEIARQLGASGEIELPATSLVVSAS